MLNSVTCVSDYTRGLDWRLDLLTTLTHDSWLHLIIAPPLIYTLHKSLQHTLSFSVCYVLVNRSLVTASNSGVLQLHRLSSLHRLPFNSLSESESKLLYDWRFTANQFVLATSPLRHTTNNFIFQLNTCGYSLCITVDAGPRHGTHDHIFLSQIRDSPNLEDKVPVFVSTRNRVARLYLQALGTPFVASYESQSYGGGIWLHLHTGFTTLSFSLMLRPTVSRPVWLGIKHPSGAYDQIFITVRQLRVCCGRSL
jgi:hypothetical protein